MVLLFPLATGGANIYKPKKKDKIKNNVKGGTLHISHTCNLDKDFWLSFKIMS